MPQQFLVGGGYGGDAILSQLSGSHSLVTNISQAKSTALIQGTDRWGLACFKMTMGPPNIMTF